MPRSLLTIPLFVLVSFLSFAQELNYVNYNTHNGLPSSEVHDLYQDKRGYLWLATDRGLVRFDGKSFKTYGLEDGLPGTVILQFYPQEDGSVWCNNLGNNIFKLIPEEERFVPYKHIDSLKYYFGNALITQIASFKDQSLKISFDHMLGYALIDKDGVTSYDYGLVNKEELRKSNNIPIEVDVTPVYVASVWENGDYFSFSTIEKKPNLGHNKFTIYPSRHLGHEGFISYVDSRFVVVADYRHASIYRDKELINSFDLTVPVVKIGKIDSTIWIGMKGSGVHFFNEDGKHFRTLFIGKTITSILKDHEGGYWFSTVASGIYYVPELKVLKHSFPQGNAVHNLDEYKGELLVNSVFGASYLVSKNTKKLFYQSKSAEFSQFESINEGDFFNHRDDNHQITVTRNNQEKTFLTNYYRNITDDADGRMMGVGANRLYLIDSTITEFKAGGIHVYYDAASIDQNRFWLATVDGLFQFNIETKEKIWHVNPELKTWISEIDRIKGNNFIAGTRGKGIFFLLGEQKVKNLTKKDGLLSNLISEVYVENERTFWVCTNLGLNRIRKKGDNYQIDSFTTEDGLTNNDVTDVLVRKDTVWVGTKSGLDFFPVSLLNNRTPKTKVFLELLSVAVNDKVVKDLTSLSHHQNKIDFIFKAISFRYKNRLKFRYKMKGLETEWNYTNEQKVSYKSLPPGDYELIIQAGVDDFWYNEKIRKKINIAPPFYATWYFITGIIAMVILLFYLFFRFRILSYNRYIIQEILRQVLRRMKQKDNSFVVRVDGQDVKILSDQVLYAKAQGNYVEVATIGENFVIREKISEFTQLVPDPQEYIQINRSTVIRKDKVSRKSKKMVHVGDVELKIGSTYTDVYDQLYL